jgi:ribosome recycling factor
MNTSTLLVDTEQRMKKAVDTLSHDLAKLRTGRAHPNFLDPVMVPYYGNDVPISQVASINVTDARTFTVTPWEKSMVAAIEKAIKLANLGLNPVALGDHLRIPVPALTEERRRELTKVARQEGEHARVGVRNIRRDANNHLKEALKAKTITEDEERRLQDGIQKLTDRYIVDVDKMISEKEVEVMAI